MRKTNDSDLLVIGGGIVGLSHAWSALRRGMSVTVVEADERPVGASVRNFGHCCITGQTGELGELADAGRESWLRAAQDAGFWIREAGAHVVASRPEELAVLEEARRGTGADRIRMVDAEEMRRVLGRHRRPQSPSAAAILGGAALPGDLRVDPRAATDRLAASVDAHPRGRVLRRTRALAVDDHGVLTSRGRVDGDHTVIAVGHHLGDLLPGLADSAEVQQCALSMALVEAPEGFTSDAAVLTGTSLLRYDTFSRTAAAEQLRARIAVEAPELLEVGANVMFARRPDGTVIVGDSHRYAGTVDPFLDEQTSQLLLDAVADVLGVDGLRVRQRWQGVYAHSAARPLVVEAVDSRTTAVTVTTGVGMTVAFGLAERTLARLTSAEEPVPSP